MSTDPEEQHRHLQGRGNFKSPIQNFISFSRSQIVSCLQADGRNDFNRRSSGKDDNYNNQCIINTDNQIFVPYNGGRPNELHVSRWSSYHSILFLTIIWFETICIHAISNTIFSDTNILAVTDCCGSIFRKKADNI
jgi:hypothetical protein